MLFSDNIHIGNHASSYIISTM